MVTHWRGQSIVIKFDTFNRQNSPRNEVIGTKGCWEENRTRSHYESFYMVYIFIIIWDECLGLWTYSWSIWSLTSTWYQLSLYQPLMTISKMNLALHYKSFEIVAYWFFLVYIAERGKIWLQNTYSQIKWWVWNSTQNNIHFVVIHRHLAYHAFRAFCTTKEPQNVSTGFGNVGCNTNP